MCGAFEQTMLHEVSKAVFFGQFIARTCADHDAAMGHFACHGLMHNSNSVSQFEYNGFYNRTIHAWYITEQKPSAKQTAFANKIRLINDFRNCGRGHPLLCGRGYAHR